MTLIDGSTDGHAYFGIALKTGTWDRLWAADFGIDPQIRAWDALLAPVDLARAAPSPTRSSAAKSKAEPGRLRAVQHPGADWQGTDYAFVAYAKSQPDPADPTQFLAAEEDAIAQDDEGDTPDRGRVAMFDLEGRLIKTFADAGRLNAPWGLAVAPADFGPMSGALLVGNFGGSGRISAFDIDDGTFIDALRSETGEPLAIEGLWGLQFGNGASLGDANALYFAAGPADETQGLFGALRHAAL